jgi:hypothetical protein
MDVASFAIVWSLVGQVAAEPFSQPPAVPNVAVPNVAVPSVAAPNVAAPAGATSSGAAQPRYGAMPPSGASDRYQQPQATQPQSSPNYAPNPGYATPPSYGTPPSYADPSNTGAPSNATPPSSYATPAGGMPRSPSNAGTPAYSPPSIGATVGTATAAAATAPIASEDKSGAGDLVRESLVLPKSLALPGKVTSLEELFNTVGDRRRQIDAVRSYWKLTADVADYHFAWQQTQFLKLLGETIDVVEKGPDVQRAKTENASRFAESQARQREAEMKLAATQIDLAERASLPTANRQPLPRDLPHVGVYNTSFEKVYAHRTPPARAYLLNRTLPLWRDIIVMRAETVWASQDAYDAAFDAYRKGQLEVDDVFLAIEELRERRSEFIAAVRRYNEEIAEYALTSAPDGTSRETLVGMLIKNSHTPKLGRAVAPADSGLVQQVTYVDEFGNVIAAPIETDEIVTEPATEPMTGTPTLAPPEVPQLLGQPQASAIPRNAIPAAKVIEQTSATLPIMNVPVSRGDETSAGAPVPPAGDIPTPPSYFAPPASAMPIPTTGSSTAPVSPFPNSDAAVLLRGEPTLAPPQKSTEDAPLKFKVNRPPFEEFEATNVPRQLPSDIDREAKAIAAASPYSSGTRLKKKSTTPKQIEPAIATTEDGPKLLVVPADEAKPISEAKPINEAFPFAEAKSNVITATPKIQIDAEVEPAGYYTQLGQLPPARRTQELVEQLHGARGLPTSKDQPATLDQCMAGSASADRREIIQAYWRAAEQATRYRVWTQKLERLDVLGQSVLQFRGQPAGSIAMLQVRAEKLSAEAARRTTLVDLAFAQWTLTNDTRRSLAGPWIMPSTPPHAGSYEAKLEGLPPAAVATARLQATAARIPKLHETMLYRADAVAAADAASDQALQKYAAGQTTIATALHALGREARTTNDLLATVTRYNLDIADYALAAVPGTAPRDALVGALVVDRIRR